MCVSICVYLCVSLCVSLYVYIDVCLYMCISIEPRPEVLWCLYFNMPEGLESEGGELPPNVSVCLGPDGSLGHDGAIAQVTITTVTIAAATLPLRVDNHSVSVRLS